MSETSSAKSCYVCGYSRVGLSGPRICPECGAPASWAELQGFPRFAASRPTLGMASVLTIMFCVSVAFLGLAFTSASVATAGTSSIDSLMESARAGMSVAMMVSSAAAALLLMQWIRTGGNRPRGPSMGEKTVRAGRRETWVLIACCVVSSLFPISVVLGNHDSALDIVSTLINIGVASRVSTRRWFVRNTASSWLWRIPAMIVAAVVGTIASTLMSLMAFMEPQHAIGIIVFVGVLCFPHLFLATMAIRERFAHKSNA